MTQPASAPRPFQNYLVEWMENELLRREAEYLDDRQRAHHRFANVVESMHDELFLYRSTGAAMRLLERVDEIVTRLRVEQQELTTLRSRWPKRR